jgi:hypothetical protein
MKKILLSLGALWLLCLCANAQVVVGNGYVSYVFSAPSGTCGQNAQAQFVIPGGTLYTCQNGTWAQISGGGGGTVASVTGTANEITATGTSSVVLSLPSTVVAPGTVSASAFLGTGVLVLGPTTFGSLPSTPGASMSEITFDSSGQAEISASNAAWAPLLNTGNFSSTQLAACYGAGGGTANAQTVTHSSNAVTSYTNGLEVCWVPTNANTAAATLNVDGVGTASIIAPGAIGNCTAPCTTLPSGLIATSYLAVARYVTISSTGYWQLLFPDTAVTAGIPWTSILHGTSNLNISPGGTSSFNATSPLTDFFSFLNTTAATSGTSQSSPTISLKGTEWHGGASVAGGIAMQFQPGNGTDAASVMNFAHEGSATGARTYQFDGAVASGANGTDAAYLSLIGNTANFAVTANTVGFMGPSSASFTGYAMQLPSTNPSGTQYLGCGTPSSGVSTCSWNTVSGAVSSVNTLTGAVVIENATAGQMAVSGGGSAALTGAADMTYSTHTFATTANGIFDWSAATGVNSLKFPAVVGGTVLNGTSTANLSAPIVITNTNSSNNNTSITMGITAPGTSTGQTVLNVNGASTGGDLADFGISGTWASGVLSGQTIEAAITPAGSIKLGTAPTVTTPGTGSYMFGTDGTEPASIAAGTSGFNMDSTSNCPIQWNNAVNVGCSAALGVAQTFTGTQTFAAIAPSSIALSGTAPAVTTSGTTPYLNMNTLVKGTQNVCTFALTTSTLTLALSPVSICAYTLPATALAWYWQCSMTWSNPAGTTPTFAIGVTWAHAPSAASQLENIYTTNGGAVAGISTQASTATTTNAVIGATGTLTNSANLFQAYASGTFTGSATSGTFSPTLTLTGTGATGTAVGGCTIQ